MTEATTTSTPPTLAMLGVQSRTGWLVDNVETYARLLEALNGARRSIRIAQLAFDFDCLAYASGAAFDAPPRDVVIAETLIARATAGGPEIQILLNASWLLNTARPLRRAFARRGISSERIQVRGFNRFPHFMHAKLVIVDSHEAFLELRRWGRAATRARQLRAALSSPAPRKPGTRIVCDRRMACCRSLRQGRQ
jgi:phosphatidylserine/phosphatidylglycerophosphate/cardiolipin synthase-like enzyme